MVKQISRTVIEGLRPLLEGQMHTVHQKMEGTANVLIEEFRNQRVAGLDSSKKRALASNGKETKANKKKTTTQKVKAATNKGPRKKKEATTKNKESVVAVKATTRVVVVADEEANKIDNVDAEENKVKTKMDPGFFIFCCCLLMCMFFFDSNF